MSFQGQILQYLKKDIFVVTSSSMLMACSRFMPEILSNVLQQLMQNTVPTTKINPSKYH